MNENDMEEIIIEQPILEFSNVTGTSRKFHLENVSFALPAGYLMGLTGKNGAGKTTLIDYIVNPKRQYQGTIRIGGVDIRENHAAMQEKIGYIAEDERFFMERTAKQNAAIIGSLYSNFQMEIFDASMEKMELSSRKEIGKMSRGEYMRFQMAFAMAHRPVIYLLDEVTAGMDPVFRLDFFKILHEVIKEGEASVLMTSHIEEEISRNMDYVGELENGVLLSFGENIPA